MNSKRAGRSVSPSAVIPQLEFEKLGNVTERFSERFRRKETVIKYKVSHNLATFKNLFEVANSVDNAYESMVTPHLEGVEDNDLLSVGVNSKSLTSDIFLPPRRKQHFNKEEFLDTVFDIAQSNDQFLLDGAMTFTIAITKNVTGGGRPKTVQEVSKSKRSVVIIANTDNMCFFRSLFVTISHTKSLPYNEWRKIREDKAQAQTKGALEIASMCQWSACVPVGRDTMPSIQEKLKNYQIIVVDGVNKKNLVYKGPPTNTPVFIEYIDGLDGGHFNAITNMKAYMGSRNYCVQCHVAYKERFQHRCKNGCTSCYHSTKHQGCIIVCPHCNRSFSGPECFDLHKHNGICSYRKCCPECKREYCTGVRLHVCNLFNCTRCNQLYTVQPHHCFIKPLELETVSTEDNMPKIFVLYDIESIQVHENNGFRHVPNLLVANTVCDRCYPEGNCTWCKGYTIYYGKDCVKRFGDYLYKDVADFAAQYKGKVYCFAHNARGYDAQFILQDLWGRCFTNPQVIMTGRKVLRITVGNVILIDSLAFFLQPLAALPKAFGLSVTVTKGYFPHHFNTSENGEYEGPLPGIEYFGVKYMKPEEASKFRIWHQTLERENFVFNFKKELIKYCKNDVEILTHSVMVFRKTFKSTTGVDPYTRCFTLASIGLEVFRTNFLKEKQLGITPIKGYSNQRNKSRSADAWLDWQEKLLGKLILREYHTGKYFSDGFIPEENHAFEFYGCKWHGCPCTKDNDSKYAATMLKNGYYNERGITLTYVWECQYRTQRRENPEMREYTNKRFAYYTKLEKYGGCDIRESFFGGRTNNLTFYCEAKDDEEIKYLDFCSLYPYVLKTKKFPIGHAHLLRENLDPQLEGYFGFAKCKILPPQRLYLPLLPVRVKTPDSPQGKLMFPLCGKCAEELSRNCSHTEDERLLVGTWTTLELQEAIKRGYIIKDVLEVLHFTDVTNTLFQPYINMWLKIKQQASGWPAWCTTEKLKLEYLTKYLDREGISLDPLSIEKNESLRFIAKIMLNSFWGKLAQRENQPSTSLVTTYNEYFSLATDNKKILGGELMVNENTMLINWRWKDGNDAPQGKTNTAVASYVTAYARLELFFLMERIERQRPHSVLYHDTDSVIYLRKFSDPEIPTGDFLGDLTDEIKKDYGNARCTKFTSLGSKNYSYQVVLEDGTTITPIKCKGFKLTENTMDVVNFKKMVEIAVAYAGGDVIKLECPQQQFITDMHHNVITRYLRKIYKPTSDKRYIVNNETYPYGYIQ